ncbi:MAG: hypothetical protein JST27_01420, partial [Bacteroidetes bacterium]|nr:hypothetical protein [Bacteroidota bacterium]
DLWPAGVPPVAGQQPAFRMAPNPARDGFQIRFAGPHGAGLLRCSNSSGQTVLLQKVAAGAATLSISSADWPAGSYLVCWQPDGAVPDCEKLSIH